MNNPFHTDILEPNQPWPRRYGKTSLVKRVQHRLSQENICVIYAQFMRLVSVEDLVHRLAKPSSADLMSMNPCLIKAKNGLLISLQSRPHLPLILSPECPLLMFK